MKVKKLLNYFGTFEAIEKASFQEISVASSEKIATIFDVTGKRVFNQMITNNELNVSSLQGGVYFLRIESDGRSITRKFIKK